MKNTIQIALLTLIAGALIYIAVTRTGSKSSDGSAGADSTASASATPPVSFAANGDPIATVDPMAQAGQAIIDNRAKTAVNFAKMEHDFGNIKQNTDNKYVFSFTNTGKEPLIIESATGSCGCTVPNYPKEPIAPGKTGSIEVVYKPGQQENQQQKQVTVVANTEPKQTILRIKANVEKDPAAATATATPAAN